MFCRDKCQIRLWQGPNAPVPGIEHGVEGDVLQRWKAFQPFLHWLISYEKWILQTHGPEWRAGCWRALKRLPKGKPWLPPALALEWWELAASSLPPRPRQLARH